MKMKALTLLSLALFATLAFGQGQTPPTAPRTQSPAQDGSQPGGLQSSTPAAAQPGQPGSPAQLQQGSQQGGQQQPGQQQSGQQRTANLRGESANPSSSQLIDGHLAACLILGNEEEVALGRFATKHASSDSVKKFAQQMVDDHTKAEEQLRQFAPQNASLQLTSSGSESGAQSRTEARANSQFDSSAANSSPTSAPQQLLAIEREAKQECLNRTEKELGEKRGSEFDHAYLGQQMVGHVQMVSTLTAFEKHASPDLQRVIAEQRKTAEQHLDHIKQLKESKTTSAASDHASGQHSGTQQPASQR